MTKKIVHYIRDSVILPIEVGGRALVIPVDHPDSDNVSNEKHVCTSRVLSYEPETGIFETIYSIYKPSA